MSCAGESDGVDDMEEDSIDAPSMHENWVIQGGTESSRWKMHVQEFIYSKGHTQEAVQIAPSAWSTL